MILRRLQIFNIRHYPRRLFYGPEWIVLGVNNLCNLHCRMCDVGTQFTGSNFYHNLMNSRPLNMPLELLRRIIDQTAHYFPRAKLGYAFTEPLIYPHLIESLRHAAEKGVHTAVTTNALTLEKQAAALAKAGLKELFISLDGPPAIHNHIRGHRRSFEKALAGIEAILSLPEPRPKVSVFCTITEWNGGHLSELGEIFRNFPLTQLGFMHTNFTPEEVAEAHNRLYGDRYPATPSNMQEIHPERMDLDILLEDIHRIRKMALPFPVTFSPELTTREALEIFYRQPERIIGRVCNDAFRTLMIKSSGAVIPAHGRCYNLEVGNIYRSTLKAIWNAPALAAFRQTLIDAGGLLPACARCCSAF